MKCAYSKYLARFFLQADSGPLLYTVNSEIFARLYFRETSHMRSFVNLKPSQNGKITLSLTDMRILCTCREFLTLQICLLILFAKIKFS